MSTTAQGQERRKILDVYLNDHLAGATAGAELARRMVQEHGDSPYGDDLRRLATEIAQDRRSLLGVLADLGMPVRHYKVYGAWLGEKVARLKPNGRLVRRSGLTVLVELEALRVGVQGKAMVWRALQRAAAREPRLEPERLRELLERAEQQLRTVDELHHEAATALLATPSVTTSV
ncbi:hypothetical protein [Streptomyces sp. NBC_00582]|uniref:hypothetical protein n=1 Tax=Streptomyces sp. NBC_00582 TaxID=2975783 RepID=UPI001062C867|nr:hypothetical protein [Streptomyces sp. NBC_00582]WUB60225.1 hypothetical protein OG852_07400 [Streptomyces sp. NBC_00582]